MKIATVFAGLGILGALVSAPLWAAADHEVPMAPGAYLEMKNPFKATPEVLEAGEKLYGKKCGRNCHGLTGNADGTAVKDLEIKPKPFTDKAYMCPKSDGQLFWIIENGSPNTDMDNYGEGSDTNLSKDDIWKLVVYIKHFAK